MFTLGDFISPEMTKYCGRGRHKVSTEVMDNHKVSTRGLFEKAGGLDQ